MRINRGVIYANRITASCVQTLQGQQQANAGDYALSLLQKIHSIRPHSSLILFWSADQDGISTTRERVRFKWQQGPLNMTTATAAARKSGRQERSKTAKSS